MKPEKVEKFRDTSQPLMPAFKREMESDIYDLYPSFPVGTGKIDIGYGAIAEKICKYSTVIVDGYIGILWEQFREELEIALANREISVEWISICDFMLPEDQIKQKKEPFLGADDPIFGTKYTGDITDFFCFGSLARFINA